jgi:HEAT repeat protein
LEALATLGRPAVPTIAGVLEFGTSDAQRAAARVLCELGLVASGARETLKASLDDSRPEIAIHAAFALLRIDPEDPEALATLKRSMSEGEVGWKRIESRGWAEAGPKAIGTLAGWLAADNERLRTMAAYTFAVGPREEPFPEAALASALKDGQWRVRLWAARALAGSNAADALRAAFDDPERAVRMAAALSLPEPAASEALLEALEFGDEHERIAAMHALAKLGEARAVPVLIRLITGDDDSLADEARTALVALGTPAIPALVGEWESGALALIGDESVPALIAASKARDSNLRSWAIRSLGSYRHLAPQVVPRLIECLEDDDPEVRSAAVDGLATVGPRAGAAALAKLRAMLTAGGAPFDDLVEAVWAIGRDASQLLPALRARLGSEDTLERQKVLWLLSDMRSDCPEADDLIESALKDRAATIRREAAGILAKGAEPSERLVAILLDGLGDEDDSGECGFALWNTGALTKGLDHADPRIRRGTAEFLSAFGIPGPSEARALIAAMRSEDREVRRLAAKAFAHQPAYAIDAEPALAALLADEDLRVASAAAESLGANGIRLKDSLPHVYAGVGRKGLPIELAAALASRGAEVVPELRRFLEEGTERERSFAALTLARVGRAASPALDLLLDLADDDDMSGLSVVAYVAAQRILEDMPPQAIGIGGRSDK